MITRIRELLEARQLSPTQFADLIGVGRPVISHILSERNKPSLEVVQKIIGAFPEISLQWLLAGTGPMLAAEAAPAPAAATSAPAAVQQPVLAVSPLPVAPATPLSPAPAPSPVAPTRPTPAPRVGSYAQPPRFRPGTAVPTTTASVEAAPLVAPAPDTAPVAPILPSSAPFAGPASPAPASPPQIAQVAAPSPIAPPPPVYADLGAGESQAAPAEMPAPSPASEVPATAPHPAAALSFLGEPGKAIRRIVIFYRDGSFSDYLPEGY